MRRWPTVARRAAMLTCLAFLLALSSSPGPALASMSTGDGSWVWENPLPQGNPVNAVHASDAAHLLAVGDHGLLLRSDDGGATWSRQPLGVTDPLLDVAFSATSPSVGVIVGGNGLVLRTSDGGGHWTAARPVADYLYGVTALPGTANTFWAVGTGGLILVSTDGGATWSARPSPTTQRLHAISFANALHGWAAGRNGTLLFTADGGTTWWPSSLGTTRDLHDVHAVSPTECWAVGNWTVLHTTTGGDGWTAVTPPAGHAHVAWTAVDVSPGGAVTIAATGDDYNWGESGGVWTSGDGGATWQTAWESRFAALTCLAHEPGGSVTWAGGAGGLLVRVTSGSGVVTAGDALPYLRAVAHAGDTLWAVGSRTLLRRDAGGWHVAPLPVLGKGASDVAFVGSDTGWVADGSIVWCTTDGGVTWTASPSLGFMISDIDFISASVGTAVSPEGRIARTADGGATWTDVTPPVALPALSAVDLVDATHGYAVGDGGCVVRTTDGSNWTTLASGVTDDLKDLCFVDATTGWVAGLGGVILATTDAGQHFSLTRVGSLGLNGISFPDAEHGWACSSQGVVLRYDHGTGTWSPVTSGTSETLADVLFADVLTGWVVGAHGAVLATTTGGVPDILPPVTTVSGVPAGWRNTAVTLTFAATDPGGSGVVTTRYRVDGRPWEVGSTCTVAAPADHSNDGTHTVAFYSVDAFDNQEGEQTCAVSIDTRKPRPRAPYPVSVVRGRTATLRYRVDDAAPCAGTARPVIKLRNASGRVVKVFRPAAKPVGTWLKLRFTCRLARGKYRVLVYATDAAGNRQAKVATTTLTVR